MIRNYKVGEHPYFVGIRVAVSIDGKLKQKYFNFKGLDQAERDNSLKRAQDLEAEWIKEQKSHKQAKDIAAKELRRITGPYTTGVRAIKFKISYSKCYFHVSGEAHGERYNKHYNINEDGFKLAWFKACRFVDNKKDYDLFDEIYENLPTKENIFVAFRHTYFNTNTPVKINAFEGIFDQKMISQFLKKILREEKEHKKYNAFKNDVLKYLYDNKIKDPAITSLI